jgi:hypothetical protein
MASSFLSVYFRDVDKGIALSFLSLNSFDVIEAVRPKNSAGIIWLFLESCHPLTINQLAMIKLLTWKRANFRMHTILRVKKIYVFRMVALHTNKKTLLVAKTLCRPR